MGREAARDKIGEVERIISTFEQRVGKLAAASVYTKDAFFVPERRARSATARALIETVQRDLAAWEKRSGVRQRKRREADQHKHNRLTEAIICEAIRLHLIAPRRAIAVSLSKQRRWRYEPAPYEPLKDLLAALGAGLELIAVTPGHKPDTGWGRRTTFAAAPKLKRLAKGLSLADLGRRSSGEPIVLRATSTRVARQLSSEVADAFEVLMVLKAELGALVDYPSNPIADGLRGEMDCINSALDNAEITLDHRIVEQSLTTRTVFDPGDRWLRRIFNNGHTDMRHGGRLYGGFWMDLKKEERRSGIIIDGEPVTELDYSAMMPRLLYAKAKQSFPAARDPYHIPPVPVASRDGVKMLFAALLFGKSALTKWPKGCSRFFPKGVPVEDVVAVLKHHHPKVASHYGSLVGFELMRWESDILGPVVRPSSAPLGGWLGFVVG